MLGISEIFREVINPIMQSIADDYNSREGEYRARIGNQHPPMPESRAPTGTRGRPATTRNVAFSQSITVYDSSLHVIVSVFNIAGSNSIIIAPMDAMPSTTIKLEDVTEEIVEETIRRLIEIKVF